MSRYSLNPDRLFDRPWRPGHPFRPKTGRFRRLAMLVLLSVLCAVIWGYGYITDARRVRAMAETYLSNLTGGRVTVEDAALSLFEGLRLDGVRVYVDANWESSDGLAAPDALLFSARTFVISYDPASMARGQLEAQQIVVEKPHVHLCHNTATNLWNFHRLGRETRPRPAPTGTGPAKPAPLPELLLRNARVEIAELRNGRDATLGFMALDGQLTPGASTDHGGHDRYAFVLQSRGLSDAMGPLVTGTVHLDTGRVIAQLKQFEFGRDVRAMLPADVGQWWERHELGGRVDVPVVDYTPPRAGRPARFRIETLLNGVNLSVPPEEWMSVAEVRRREDARAAAGAVRRAFAAAGFAGRPPAAVGLPPGLATAAAAAVPPSNPADGLLATLESMPVQLRQVAGSFVFTDQGIDVRGLTGRIENNLITIDGRIDGYRPESPVTMRIASAASEDLHIPASPRYVGSLPPAVREFYEKIRPQGTCRVQLDVSRPAGGGAVEVGGFVELLDASFVFDEFPYPIRRTHGRIELARDPQAGRDWIVIKNLRGYGAAGGPNADRQLAVDGWIGPVGPTGIEPGGSINIRAADIRTEPALHAAFDADVREALALFDAPGKGQFPIFRADAAVHVHKDVGAPGPFKVNVDLDIKEADGMLVGFPYPLRKLAGLVRIREGYCDVVNVRIPHPTASVSVDGRVAWELKGKQIAGPLARRKTDLNLTVRGLPVDDDLLSALPKESADWIACTGVAGRIDVDGRLLGQEGGVPFNRGTDGPALRYDLAIALRDGTLRPKDSDFAVGGVAGRLRLTPERLDLLELKGTRAGAALSAVGQVTLGSAHPQTLLVVSADNLPLDRELYNLIPEAARSAWDEVRPVGTLDGEITFACVADPVDKAAGRGGSAQGGSVTVVDLSRTSAGQSTQPAALVLDLPASDTRPAVRRELPLGLHGVIRPRKLAASIRTVPYPLEQLAGEVAVSPDRIELRNITARHGNAELAIHGTGLLWPQPTWTLSVAAKNLPADAELRKALPASLAGLLDSVKVGGTLGVELDRFVYRSAPTQPSPAGATTPAAGPEMDLGGRVTLTDVSMDAGVPLERIRGTIGLSAAVRHDRLEALAGRLDIESLDMAGRHVTGLRATLAKPPESTELSLTKLQAAVAGGDLAGQASIAYPETGPTRYALSLFLRNADVRELAKEAGENVNGRVTASLALEGSWGKQGVRRGRGDVVVSGKEMYRIPLMLGLMQVTNLALPISTPFNAGTARYSVDGERVTFERIELRSNNMVMSGDGHLDFGTKQVRMQFVTDNAAGFKVPFLQDLWRGAQQELLRIQVRGTVQDPKVENRPLGTFTTTVDEVFKGDQPKTKPKK